MRGATGFRGLIKLVGFRATVGFRGLEQVPRLQRTQLWYLGWLELLGKREGGI